MMQSRKQKLLPEAQALRDAGASTNEIAESLGVPPGTVRRWLSGEAGKHAPGTDGLRRKLEARLKELIEESEPQPQAAGSDETKTGKGKGDEAKAGKSKSDEAKVEDRMLKLCKVLEFLREDEDDITPQLDAMKRFASFCVRTLTEDEMPPVRKAVRLFLDNLKREHT